MYVDNGRSLSTGYFLIADQLTREELSYLQRTRDLSRYCRSSTALGAGGVPVAGGGEARQARDRGRRHPWLVHMELNRGDGSLGTFVGVHAGRLLAGTRNALAWGALGHATGASEAARRSLHDGSP